MKNKKEKIKKIIKKKIKSGGLDVYNIIIMLKQYLKEIRRLILNL